MPPSRLRWTFMPGAVAALAAACGGGGAAPIVYAVTLDGTSSNAAGRAVTPRARLGYREGHARRIPYAPA